MCTVWADERRRMSTFPGTDGSGYERIPFHVKKEKTKLTRVFPATPFVPGKKEERDLRCEEILNIQAMGLKKRLDHVHSQRAMVGLSGGLDSTLALLVMARAFDRMKSTKRADTLCDYAMFWDYRQDIPECMYS